MGYLGMAQILTPTDIYQHQHYTTRYSFQRYVLTTSDGVVLGTNVVLLLQAL